MDSDDGSTPVMIHHGGTEGTEGFYSGKGSLSPENTNSLVVAQLPDALRVPNPSVPSVPPW